MSPAWLTCSSTWSSRAPRFTRKWPKALRDHGANFNGTTNSDRTNYFETMPASDENLEFGISLESDRLVNSYVKGADLLSEMTVVRNELNAARTTPPPSSISASRHGLRMAQLWKVDDRQPLRHRARAHRKPPGLLQKILSAR